LGSVNLKRSWYRAKEQRPESTESQRGAYSTSRPNYLDPGLECKNTSVSKNKRVPDLGSNLFHALDGERVEDNWDNITSQQNWVKRGDQLGDP